MLESNALKGSVVRDEENSDSDWYDEAVSEDYKMIRSFNMRAFQRFSLDSKPSTQITSRDKRVRSLSNIISENWTGSRIYRLNPNLRTSSNNNAEKLAKTEANDGSSSPKIEKELIIEIGIKVLTF